MNLNRRRNVVVFIISTVLSFPISGMQAAIIMANSDEVASHPREELILAQKLIKGDGCPQDYVQAHEHLMKACDQLDDLETQAWAHMRLALLFYFGWGVTRDEQKALKYAELAIQQSKGLKGLEEIGELADILKNPRFDVRAVDTNGATPLHSASQHGKAVIVEFLVAIGAEVRAVDKNGHTPLLVAVNNGHREVVELLLAQGAGTAVIVPDTWLPLHLACYKGHGDIVEVLLDQRADIRAVHKDGTTALHWAAQKKGNSGVVKLLLAQRADIQAVSKDDTTALHSAAYHGHIEIVEELLAQGADVKAVDRNGHIPLHLAVYFGHEGAVRILLAKGSDVELRSNSGQTATNLARSAAMKAILRKKL